MMRLFQKTFVAPTPFFSLTAGELHRHREKVRRYAQRFANEELAQAEVVSVCESVMGGFTVTIWYRAEAALMPETEHLSGRQLKEGRGFSVAP